MLYFSYLDKFSKTLYYIIHNLVLLLLLRGTHSIITILLYLLIRLLFFTNKMKMDAIILTFIIYFCFRSKKINLCIFLRQTTIENICSLSPVITFTRFSFWWAYTKITLSYIFFLHINVTTIRFYIIFFYFILYKPFTFFFNTYITLQIQYHSYRYIIINMILIL